MRYLHRGSEDICSYVESRGMSVWNCDCKGVQPPVLSEPAAISSMLEQSATLRGTAQPFYLMVMSSHEWRAESLSDAVRRIEQGDGSDGFCILAYQDGGLISVTATKMAFQQKAEPAVWWRPN